MSLPSLCPRCGAPRRKGTEADDYINRLVVDEEAGVWGCTRCGLTGETEPGALARMDTDLTAEHPELSGRIDEIVENREQRRARERHERRVRHRRR